jgi:hypothetical protein
MEAPMIIDAFDADFDRPVSPAPASRGYAVVPTGEVAVEVVAADIADVRWKASTDNPSGTCLRLRLTAGREFAFVFADVPQHMTWLRRAVAAALGLTDDELEPGAAIGGTARVVITHFTARDGTVKAGVARWLPRRPAAPARDRSQAGPPAAATKTLVDCVREWAAGGDEPQRPGARTQAPGERGKPRATRKVSRNAVPRYVADDDIPF